MAADIMLENKDGINNVRPQWGGGKCVNLSIRCQPADSSTVHGTSEKSSDGAKSTAIVAQVTTTARPPPSHHARRWRHSLALCLLTMPVSCATRMLKWQTPSMALT